jgi:DNA-binding LacI/PurR family transcriptional regulator
MNKVRFQVSQKRIAEQAGVSQSTVSLVLSGRRGNSDQTSQRVLEAAERLKYRPNLLVQGIQTGKTRMIGVMMPPFDYFWTEVLYGIHDVLTAADNVPITLWTVHTGPSSRRRNNSAGSGDELAQIHRMVDRRVDGVILWPSFAQLFVEHIHEFSSRNLPVVTIDHQLPPEFNSDFVGSDEGSGGRMVAEHLYALGHRRIGHLAAPAVASWALARRKAFSNALSDMPGVSLAIREATAGEMDLGIIPARELLALPDRPTAIFAACDLYAKTVYRAAKEFDLRIPEDLTVVGFSDDDFACEMSPPLSSVRQPAYEIGRRAAEVVLGRSSGRIRDRGRHEELPVQLIVRESSHPPRSMAGRN